MNRRWKPWGNERTEETRGVPGPGESDPSDFAGAAP